MKVSKLTAFKSSEIKFSDTINLVGGMTCTELADQLDDMWAMGGKEAKQADNIMYMIEAGYKLCDAPSF